MTAFSSLRQFLKKVRRFIPHQHLKRGFLLAEINLHTLIPLFMPGSVHSVSASWDNCGWMFSDELHVSLFP